MQNKSVSALSVIQAAGINHYSHERFLKSRFSALPKRFRPSVNQRYIEIFTAQNFRQANLMLVEKTKALEGKGSLLAGSDAELCEYAKNCAKQAFSIASRFLMVAMAVNHLDNFTLSKGVQPPNEKLSESGRLSRMLCEKWWRRAIRKSIARDVERMAIDLGLVCKQKGIYASDETCARRSQQKKRNADLLKTIIAVNEQGDEYTLEALSALNVSNPELRRAELMTRIAGFDEIAIKLNHAADFYTLTCPSKYHAIGYDGKTNTKYEGFTPKQAQTFLSSTWAKVRAYLAKHGVKVYGFRVAEAHHDGTPHWHMILFYEKQYKQFIRKAIKKYWLKVDGDEAGASDHRCKVEAIDRKKGSAAGYLAKYISKNIDAHGLDGDSDFEGGELSKNINRVDAWAACWGIRQFQQIGGAPVGVWRECRRLDTVAENETGIINELLSACDCGNWARYTELQGGGFVSRKDLIARVERIWFDDARTLYDGYGMDKVQGISIFGLYEKTRVHKWSLKRGCAVLPSWSSVNNCNQNLGGMAEKRPNKAMVKIRSRIPIKNIERQTGIFDDETIVNFDKRSFENGL